MKVACIIEVLKKGEVYLPWQKITIFKICENINHTVKANLLNLKWINTSLQNANI